MRTITRVPYVLVKRMPSEERTDHKGRSCMQRVRLVADCSLYSMAAKTICKTILI